MQNNSSQIERRKSMILIRKIFPVLIIATFMFSGFLTDAIGQESMRPGDKSLCKNGKFQRSVQVQYYAQEKQVPCEVHYYKNAQQPDMGQVLWRATNEVGFCEKKMAVFLDELSNSGWSCQQVAAGSADSSPDEERIGSRKEILPPDLSSK